MATMRYREALNQAMREEMRADESVFLMGEDVGVDKPTDEAQAEDEDAEEAES